MNKKNSISNKIMALLLSIVLCIGMLPAGVISSVFAETEGSFQIKIEGYSEQCGTVTLTQTDDESIKKEVSIGESGTAEFSDFVDFEKTYTISVSDLIGYENYTGSSVAFSGDSYIVSGLTQIDKITVSGAVEAGESKVTVSYSAYNGKVKGSTVAENGAYSFEFYKGIEYSVSFDSNDEKYNDITGKKVTVSSPAEADFGTETLDVKQFVISTNCSNNGKITDSQNVNYGEDATDITVEANEHYVIDELLLDGKEITDAKGAKKYTLTKIINNVKETHSVSATFIQDEYNVSFVISRLGKVTITDGNPASTVGEVCNKYDDVTLYSGKYLKIGQKITASVLENYYHIKSFKVNETEKIENANNDTDSYEYTYNSTETQNISVVFALDEYNVNVESEENGTAKVDDSKVDWNNTATVTITPNDGYNIESVKVNNNPDDSFTTDNGYEYTLTINNIKADTTVKIEYSEIAAENLDNVSFTEAKIKDADNGIYIYNHDAEVNFKGNSNVKRIKINGVNSDFALSGNANYQITKSTVVNSISVYYDLKWHSLTLDKNINIIIDKVAPKLGDICELSWANKDVVVSGTARDDATPTTPSSGLDYVVWSENSLSAEEVISEKINKSKIDKEGKYSFTVSNETEQNQTYYVYAIDNAGNVSEAKTVVVKIDTTKPVVGFTFNSKNNSKLSKVLNFLTFGLFFNEELDVTANVSDGDKACDSQCKSVKFFLKNEDGTETTEEITVENNTAKTDIPLNFRGTVYATVTDNAGNVSDKTLAEKNNSNLLDEAGFIMIEKEKPDIDITPNYNDETKHYEKKTEETLQNWYNNSDIDFIIKANDADSGLDCVEISINGTVLANYYFTGKKIQGFEGTYTLDKEGKVIGEGKVDGEVIQPKEFIKSTESVKLGDDGSYVLKVSVTDNAGNVSECEKIIYKDTTPPTIEKFDFAPEEFDESDGKPVTDSESKPLGVEKTPYGFYFKKDTKVIITAADAAPSAGVKSISYKTVDEYGKETPPIETKVDENNKIYFTINANFKGQIYAYATDNVDNSDKIFQHPDGTVIENEDKHKEQSGIEITLPETKVKDEKGNNLYSKNTDLGIKVHDNYSGIKTITWEIVSPFDDKNQKGTISVENSGIVTYQGDSAFKLADNKEFAIDKNLVTEIPGTLTVSNNSNSIMIKMTLTDRAGNKSDCTKYISIDKTAPKIVVKMNENDDNKYQGFFKTNRTADIYVYERNFNQVDFICSVNKVDDNGNNSKVEVKPAFKRVSTQVVNGLECYVYKMSKTFSADGDYSFALAAKDKVANSANDGSVKYSSDKTDEYLSQNDTDRGIDKKFTVDKTNPVVSVSYDNNNAQNTKYFKASRTATITVKEHNFTADNNKIIYTRTSNLDGKSIQNPSVSSWSRNGNIYTATISYSSDGDYTFGMSVEDKSGNIVKDEKVNYQNGREVSKNFTVDTKISSPVISGIKNGNSYKDKVIPQILLNDVNYANCTVKLLRTSKDQRNVDVTNKFITSKPVNRKTVSENTFTKIRENDGIYTLSVSYSDKAGNKSSKTVTFTVNRFGSVYVFSKYLTDIQNKYIQSVKGNVSIAEYNPDRLKNGSLKIRITCDNTPISPIKSTVTPEVNNQAPIGSSGWYQYDYLIDNSNFKHDGIYTISVASEDSVGNKTNAGEIKFMVDDTAPIINQIKGLEKQSYNETSHNVDFNVSDAMGLKSVVVQVNGKALKTIKAVESKNGYKLVELGSDGKEIKTYDIFNCKGSITLPEGANQEVRLIVTNLAGKVTDTSASGYKPNFEFHSNVTVSTNIFVLWYANTLLFWGSIGGVVLIAAAVFVLVSAKKRKKDNLKQDK